MIRNATLIAMLTCFGFAVTGCPKKADKPATDKKASAKKTEKKADDKKTDDKKADDKKAGGVEVGALAGVAECEAYVKAYNCMLKNVADAKSREMSVKSFNMGMKTWAKLPNKKAMGTACKAALDGIKAQVGKSPVIKKLWDGCL